jgi:DNA-binding NtrC family response regulator
MGGWNCLKEMRATHPKLPVLITTGYGGQDIPAQARQEGAAGLIAKPYHLENLFRTVRETLDQSNRPDRDPDLK